MTWVKVSSGGRRSNVLLTTKQEKESSRNLNYVMV